MDDAQLRPAPHPLAKPGYGKIAAPEQRPRTADDFARLPAREAAVAAYIDRLPDGSDISVKTLAAVLPLWGQCALRTALNRLTTAGHLHRVRQQLSGQDTRWVTRTFFSRTARDGAWWTTFTRRERPAPGPAPGRPDGGPAIPAPPALEEQVRTEPGARRPPGCTSWGSAPNPAPQTPEGLDVPPAYDLLSSLTRTAPALALSKADCTALAPLLVPWLDRGLSPDRIRLTLTAGLPPVIHHPAALVRKRLESKLPAAPPPRAEPTPDPPVRAECTECQAPGPPTAFTDGLCRACRPRPVVFTPPLTPPEVHAHAALCRRTLGA
ncbi:hypothetical protein LG634_14970 [Streptomyces bambusae]|uniref:hypothetical protein n=1 Tax=Streptomyces bambusae TaxID=1550616 RepID=UPI001CFD2340|nr:hypothetical protein [Streptomyces bambusae]MCB5166130.1 hypothetical protein [Streptomyces bambusae]